MTVRPVAVLPAALALGLWLAGCAAPASAPAPTAAARPTGAAGPVREVLPNGVVLIAQDHRAADMVAVQLWMRVGVPLNSMCSR